MEEVDINAPKIRALSKGFKIVPIYRGFKEIEKFFEICQANDAVICGGYARYCASPLPTAKVVIAGDVDLFPKNEEATKKILAALEAMGYEKRHENNMAITMKPTTGKKEALEVYPIPQIIKPVVDGNIVTVGTVEEILTNFDFTIVRAAIISSTEAMVDEDFLEDEKHKVLRLKNIHCPISSLLRCCKYAKKGYFMRPAEALKLFNDWTNRGEPYRVLLLELFSRSGFGEKSEENPDGMTQEEIDELESLLRVD